MRVIILGSGSSSGTPAIGNDWGRCNPFNPKNRRTRPSIVVEERETRLLIDTSPDLRFQFLANDIARVSAVLLTHSHADHLHGIDDLRAVNRIIRAPLDLYASSETLREVRTRFGYATKPLPPAASGFYRPVLVGREVGDGSRFRIGDIDVSAFDQNHGFSRTLGFRFGQVAYSTDVVELPEHAFEILAGVRLWIVGAFSERPHPSHCHVDQALDWIRRVRPEVAVLSHLSNEVDYDALKARLPAHVRPAFDGMTLDEAAGYVVRDDSGDEGGAIAFACG